MITRRLAVALAWTAAVILSSAVVNSQAPARVGFPDYSKITNEKEFADYVIKYRSDLDASVSKPWAERALRELPVKYEATKIAGVPVEDFQPTAGVAPANKNRVLINVHGGGWIAGAVYLGRVESVPIAAFGKFRVVSIDYRQGYEHKFPAANEDVAAVYQALLKQYPAKNVGLYGCSAGGALTGQATAWMLDKKIPVPAAIGIFGSGLGTVVRPPSDEAPTRPVAAPARRFGYFSAVDPGDPLAYPINAPDLLAKFPPTMLVTGTKAPDMPPALAAHRALIKAGADASLHVFDEQGHCFIYQYGTPEGKDANEAIVQFFDRHLGR
jgi:acetyl esterase/lipase